MMCETPPPRAWIYVVKDAAVAFTANIYLGGHLVKHDTKTTIAFDPNLFVRFIAHPLSKLFPKVSTKLLESATPFPSAASS